MQRIFNGLRSAGQTTFLPAETADMEVDAAIDALHEREYIEFLRNQSETLQEGSVFMDNTHHAPGVRQDTPIVPNAYAFAREGVRTAISAAKAISSGARCTYAVCRPPGHHAGSGWFGGYCYFNNAVAAACEISAENKTRVGIVDIDFHFGNGSAELASTRQELFFASLHASTERTFPYIEPPVPGDRQVFVSFEVPRPRMSISKSSRPYWTLCRILAVMRWSFRSVMTLLLMILMEAGCCLRGYGATLERCWISARCRFAWYRKAATCWRASMNARIIWRLDSCFNLRRNGR